MSEVLKAVNVKIDCLTRQLAVVTAENIELKKKIIVLEARLAEYETPKDSHNSSTPPSKESIKAQALRSTRSLREKSGKPTGGQKGHKGYTLEMTSDPDVIEEHQPHYCTRCGKDLSPVDGSVVEVCDCSDPTRELTLSANCTPSLKLLRRIVNIPSPHLLR